jgi:hypothetical protein
MRELDSGVTVEASREKCPAFAVERGVVLDCVLPPGHETGHDPGDVLAARYMMRDLPCPTCGGTK